MPWVKVVHTREVDNTTLNKLSAGLQEIVARALNVPEVKGAQLCAEDVELFFERADSRNKCKPLNILVLANFFEQRKVDLKERTAQMSKEIYSLLNEPMPYEQITHGFVYVRLGEAGFSEF